MAGAKVGKMKLGSQGLEVSAQGLGCMGMSAFYGPAKPKDEMIKLLHHAVDSGVTMLDTSDVYGPHTNELLLAKALKGGIREKVQLATKFGVSLATGKMVVRGDPEYVREVCEESLKRLDIDYIDLYYQHRVDTNVPIEFIDESVFQLHFQLQPMNATERQTSFWKDSVWRSSKDMITQNTCVLTYEV